MTKFVESCPAMAIHSLKHAYRNTTEHKSKIQLKARNDEKMTCGLQEQLLPKEALLARTKKNRKFSLHRSCSLKAPAMDTDQALTNQNDTSELCRNESSLQPCVPGQNSEWRCIVVMKSHALTSECVGLNLGSIMG